MNLSGPFIRRPVATTLIVMAMLIFGILGYRVLPVSDLPSIDFPTIQVQASLPGGSPETMAAAVATNEVRTSPCSSRWTATSTPPHRTCSR